MFREQQKKTEKKEQFLKKRKMYIFILNNIATMLAIPLNIVSCEDTKFVQKKRKVLSCALHTAYKKLHAFKSKTELINYIKDKYKLVDFEARSAVLKAEESFEKENANKKKIEGRIVECEKLLNEAKAKKKHTKRLVRDIFKLNKKLNYLNKSLLKDIVFGSRKNLQKIGYWNNFKGKTITLDNGLIMNGDEQIETFTNQYQNDRLRGLYLLGEANQKGNRFFKFDLTNNTIIYKPSKNKHVEFKFKCYGKNVKILTKLQELIDKKDIAITIEMFEDRIMLYYDDAVLSGYCIDEKERRKEVEKIKKEHVDKEEITKRVKEKYKEFYGLLQQKQLLNKKPNRYLSIDANPSYLGWSILDKVDDNGNFEIVKTGYFDFSKLDVKLPKDATIEERSRQNKRKEYAVCNAFKEIFDIFSYYHCAYFVKEELDFKIDEAQNTSSGANRLTHNLWYRPLQDRLVKKYSNRLGFIIKETPSYYTSTIGNILYNYVDCVNAAIEIGRRGIFMFNKGFFYPLFCSGTINHAMNKLRLLNPKNSADVDCLKDCKTWVAFHQSLNKTGLRYRVSESDMCLIGDIKPQRLRNLKHLKVVDTIFV